MSAANVTPRSTYVFFIEGLNREEQAMGVGPADAQAKIWARLTEEEKDRVVVFDWIDTIKETPK